MRHSKRGKLEPLRTAATEIDLRRRHTKRGHIPVACAILLMAGAPSCGRSGAFTEGADLGASRRPTDFSVADASDLAVPALQLVDLGIPDLAGPDFGVPDLAIADDLAMPDLLVPDLAMPDLAMPDLLMPDLLPPPDLHGAPPKRIFVTSQKFNANLGGLSGADSKCQALADAAALGGIYKAWLSDSNTAAKKRLGHSLVPYTLVDGTVVADNWTALTGGHLHSPIYLTETGSFASFMNISCSYTGGTTTSAVWTHTLPDGSTDPYRSDVCLDWTSATDTAMDAIVSLGSPLDSGRGWTSACAAQCSGFTAPLYCLEQ